MKFHWVGSAGCWLLLLLLTACSKKEASKRLLVDGEYAEGNIAEDSAYNGKVSFYDSADNHLLRTANYQDGLLQGWLTMYYPNGSKQEEVFYKDDLMHDQALVYDSSGALIRRQSYFHGLYTGHTTKYRNGLVKHYRFSSLECDELFFMDYDSSQGQSTEKLNDGKLFFWYTAQFTTQQNPKPQTDLFIYLPNPPKLDFRYSLWVADSSASCKRSVRNFDQSLLWETITLDSTLLGKNEIFALKLQVKRDVNGASRPTEFVDKLAP